MVKTEKAYNKSNRIGPYKDQIKTMQPYCHEFSRINPMAVLIGPAEANDLA